MVDTHFAAWLAGFFDGEGFITMGRARTGPHTLIVAVTQSDPSVLEIIRKVYGGSITVSTHKGAPVGCNSKYRATRDGLRLVFNFWEARALLQDMLPYLVVKQLLAQIALDYIATTLHLAGLRGGYRKMRGLTGVEKEMQKGFYLRFRSLNSGVPLGADLDAEAKPLPKQSSLPGL